jgi:hypothetical protein
MPLHRVTWEIDIEAKTPKEAARKALEIQHDPLSPATVFTVKTGNKTRTIDLMDE